MKTVALGEAKDKLAALVDEAVLTLETVQITKHRRPAAVLISADDLESLHETIFWLSQPDIHEDIAEGRREYADGETTDGDELRREFGLPPIESSSN